MKNNNYGYMKEHVSKQKKEIGRRFKEFRTAIGKTQTQLAHELNVYQSTITNIEIGKTFPSIPYIFYFNNLYYLNPTWLLTGAGKPFLVAEEEEAKSWMKSLIPCHLEKNDIMYKEYVELLDLMRIQSFEKVIMGKFYELKIIGKNEIELLRKNEKKNP